MDTHAFASLAQVRVLLIPVGTILQSTFEKYAAEIRSFESIRLGDIPADTKDERARFMPNPLSAGHLHLSFPTHPPPSSHLPLSLLCPSHFPLAVIGIATSSQTNSLESILAQFHASLGDIFPPVSIFPLAKNCFVFEESEGGLNLGDSLPGLVVIPSMMGNKKIYIGTLLADLCSSVLGEFGVVVQALETPLGNEYLNSSLLPILPSLSEIPSPLDGNVKRDSLPPLPSHNSQPDMSRTGVGLVPPSLKRNSSSGPSVRQSMLTAPTPKKRVSAIGAASSHGRLFKVLGDLFLLAGRTEDAMVWYTEALQLFKPSQDATWHASALEGVATVSIIEAWSAGHGLHNSTSATKEPWADVSEKLAQATVLYSKSPMTDGEQNYSLLAYLYCSCVLRHSALLFSIWSAKGWGPLAFTTMLQPGPTPYLPPTLSYEESNDWLNLERLSSISAISRSSISAILAQAHGPWLLHLGARERIAMLEAMSSIYACLGYRRKEAYILREVLGCVLDLVVCGREEDGFSRLSNVPIAAGLGIQSVGPGIGNGRGSVGIRLNENSDGNESILKLLKYTCRVMGINLDAVRLLGVGDGTATTTIANENDYEDDSDGYQEPYGWPELQVGVVREAVAVAEALPDFSAVAQFALSSLKTLQSVLTPADQYHLYSTSNRALLTAQRRGDEKHVEYWSGNPIVSIAVAPLPLHRILVEKPASALQPASSDKIPILTGGTDPFLYNPRKVVAGQVKTLIIQNEIVEFVVTLQNPYIFDLELQKLALSTSGIQFDSQPVRVVIPANSLHHVSLSGKALQTGLLVIRGCLVQAPGGTLREFIIPILSAEEDERLSRKRSARACEMGRSKSTGLESFPWKKLTKRASTQVATTSTSALSRFLECKAVPEQPLLRIRRTSVTHGALMLYDGEISTIRITLENVSSLPVDFIRLVFDDSTIAPAQQALADGNLSVFDTYEAEYGLIHTPVFSWKKDNTIYIAPGQKHTLTVTCFGKVGCTNGAAYFSYSNAHRPQASEIFHTRQLSYPLTVTVYHMLECHGMDIIPFPHYSSDPHSYRHAGSRLNTEKEYLYVDEGAGWCLFSIEVRNTYGLPFEITFERVQRDIPTTITTMTIPPGSMSRIVLPVKKFLLSEEHLSKPIPTLSDRQFVVTKSKLSKQESKAQRELFWYREELFKCVRGRWQEAGGTRSGDLSLRQQRMTFQMLQTLRLETARVHMSLVSHDDVSSKILEIDHDGQRYNPKPNEFLRLRTSVTNLSNATLVFTVDLRVEPQEHIVHEGVLTDLPIGQLESGGTLDVETALCFLAYGQFEMWAEVRVVGAPDMDKAGTGHITAVVAADSH